MYLGIIPGTIIVFFSNLFIGKFVITPLAFKQLG